MKKRILSVAFVCIIAAFGLVGCKPPEPPPPLEEQAPATLRMWGGGTQWRGDYGDIMIKFINDFNAGLLGDAADALNLTIELDVQDSVEAMIPTAISDMYNYPHLMIWDRFSTPHHAYEGYLNSIDEYLTDINLNDFNAEALKEMNYFTKQDKATTHQYGLPIDVDPWGVYVNIGLVKNHNSKLAGGTSDPKYVDVDRFNNTWTWYDVMDIAERLTGSVTGDTVAGFSSYDMEQHFFKYITSTGLDFTKTGTDGKIEVNVNNQQAKDVLAFFNKLYSKRVGKENLQEVHFVQNKIAMLNQATYYGSYISKMKGDDATFEYKFLPQPRYSGITAEDHAVKEGAVNGGMIGGFGLAMPKLAQSLLNNEQVATYYNSYAKRAAEFIKWWSHGEGAAHWAKYSETLPALTKLHTDDTVMTTVVQKSAVQFVNNYKIRPNTIGFTDLQKYGINIEVSKYTIKANPTAADMTSAIENLISSSRQYLNPLY